MFVIAGASGHTGSVAAATLLAQGKRVRVIVRDEKKGAAGKDKGAEVAVAQLDDAAALTAALRGADGVYALLPPNYAGEEPLAWAKSVTDAWAQAIAAARPKHVVLLSSIGSELDGGTGPIVSTHRAEKALGATGVKLTALRCGYFMENWGAMVHPVRSDGVLPSMLTLGRAASMVATADIGRVAAETLLAGERAPSLIELTGPRDYTPEEVAAAFGRALGKNVAPVQVPEEGIEPALAQAGFKPKLAALFREMTAGFNSGRIRWTGTPVRGKVGIDDVVRVLVA